MKFAPVLIKETFVTIGSSRDNHTLTGKDCVRAYIRTSKMVKTSKVTQEHRDLAFSLKEDLTRFANNVGYGNDLDDEDLSVAVNNIANHLHENNLIIDNFALSKRVKKLKDIHMKANGTSPKRPGTNGKPPRSTWGRSHSPQTKHRTLKPVVQRPKHLQRKFGLGETVKSHQNKNAPGRMSGRVSRQSSMAGSAASRPPSSANRSTKSSLPKSENAANLKSANKNNNTDAKHRPPSTHRNRQYPMGHNALLKLVKRRVVERSRSTGSPVIWLRRLFSKFDKDKNNILDLDEFTQGMRLGLGFHSVLQEDIDSLFTNVLDKKKEGAIRFEDFVYEFTPHEFESPKVLEFSDRKLSDKDAISQMKKDFGKAIHTYSKTMRGLFVQMAEENRQGQVTKPTLQRQMNKYGIAVGNPRAVDLLFQACDVNGDGVITYNELAETINERGFQSGFKVIPQQAPKPKPLPLVGVAKLHGIVIDAVQKRAKGPNDLRRVFNRFDKNNDETVDLNEFRSVLRSYLKVTQVNDTDIMQLFQKYDKEKSGNISYPVFIEAIMPPDFVLNGANKLLIGGVSALDEKRGIDLQKEANEIKHRIQEQSILKFRNVRKFFLSMDRTGLGRFTKTQLKVALRKAGIGHLNERGLDKVFEMCDVNKDGVVDYNEFMTYMLEIDGPALAKWDAHAANMVYAVDEYDNLPPKEKLDHWKTAQARVIGNFDPRKARPTTPCANVINGIYSAKDPPWDVQFKAGKKANAKNMYKTTQDSQIGKRCYEKTNPRNVVPSAIRVARRPLSIPGKLEIKALTNSLKVKKMS